MILHNFIKHHGNVQNWFAVGFVVIVLALSPSLASAQAPKRNIVLLVSDDHSPDLGVYGNPVIQTPNLDALANDGVIFNNAYATTASCSASRSVILSGLQNHRNGQYGHYHDFHRFLTWDHIKTLPVLLREGGYRTARAGKFHVGTEETYSFDETLPSPERSSIIMAEGISDFINEKDERPFFLYFATNDPHRGARRKDDGTIAGLDDVDTPDDFGNLSEGASNIDNISYDPADVIVPDFLPDTPMTRIELAAYYQAVSRMDKGFGKVIEILKKSGKYDDTLIIYMSDHGIAFPGAKTTTYDAGLNAPLIVRHPDNAKRGTQNDAMISWVDITPTILDFAGLAEPSYNMQIMLTPISQQMEETHGLHGRSFLSVLDQTQPEGWDEIYASHTFHEIQMYYPMRVVRGRKYKLIWNIAHDLPYPAAADLWESPTWQRIYRQGGETMFGPRTVDEYMHRPEFELFDIENDPLESNNLAYDPVYSEILEVHKTKIREFQRTTQDPWLLKWTYE